MKCFVALLVAIVLATASCYSPQGRPDYTASGALAGGATGAIIGSMSHPSGSGTVLGGAVGAMIGGLIGHGMDQAQEATLKVQSPQTLQRIEQGQPLSIADVQALARAGIGDDLIISQIRNSRTLYYLTTANIIMLKNTGVSERVIDFMINTPSQVGSDQAGGVVGQYLPPPPQHETIEVAPGPDYLWVTGTWIWLSGLWHWRPGYWYRPIHPIKHRHPRRHWHP